MVGPDGKIISPSWGGVGGAGFASSDAKMEEGSAEDGTRLSRRETELDPAELSNHSTEMVPTRRFSGLKVAG